MPAVRFMLAFLLACLIITARRWPQFISPDVWVEDGTLVIPTFAREGWLGLFVPVAGYLVIPSKIISYVSLSLTFLNYAIVSTILATCAQAAVVATIAAAPTLLVAPFAAAMIVALLPIGSEMYALPSYTFWWTSLLLFPGLLWRDGRGLWTRLAVISIAGLSSPLVIAAGPVFALRAIFQRTRDNLAAASLAAALAVLQGVMIWREHTFSVSPFDAFHHLPTLLSKYFGTAFYSEDRHGAAVFGILVVLLLASGVFFLPRERRPVYLMLALCLGSALATSVSRVSVEAPHPILAGPRYFFFSTTLIGWMLLSLAVEARRGVGLAAAVVMGAYLPSLATSLVFEPQIPKETWKEQASACEAAAGNYTFDIQYGRPDVHWEATMRGEECRRLARGSLLDAAPSPVTPE